MADTILNVNNEMNRMQELITEVGHCRNIVNEITSNSKLYKTNVMTLYQVAAAILRYNKPLIYAGVGLALVAAVVLILDNSLLANTDLIFIIAMIVSSIVFFMYFYTFVPVIFTFIQWMIVLVSNFRMKKQVWMISRSV